MDGNSSIPVEYGMLCSDTDYLWPGAPVPTDVLADGGGSAPHS
ncbi:MULTISPECIES: hypothetical protein [unclassified Crossiella]|nr:MULTISPECIES: hypothetical protein [unclassified Crossiella]